MFFFFFIHVELDPIYLLPIPTDRRTKNRKAIKSEEWVLLRNAHDAILYVVQMNVRRRRIWSRFSVWERQSSQSCHYGGVIRRPLMTFLLQRSAPTSQEDEVDLTRENPQRRDMDKHFFFKRLIVFQSHCLNPIDGFVCIWQETAWNIPDSSGEIFLFHPSTLIRFILGAGFLNDPLTTARRVPAIKTCSFISFLTPPSNGFHPSAAYAMKRSVGKKWKWILISCL